MLTLNTRSQPHAVLLLKNHNNIMLNVYLIINVESINIFNSTNSLNLKVYTIRLVNMCKAIRRNLNCFLLTRKHNELPSTAIFHLEAQRRIYEELGQPVALLVLLKIPAED